MSTTRDERKAAGDRYHARRAAALLGKKGGSVSSPAKTAAVRENGKKGGRPRSPSDHALTGIIESVAIAERVLLDARHDDPIREAYRTLVLERIGEAGRWAQRVERARNAHADRVSHRSRGAGATSKG